MGGDGRTGRRGRGGRERTACVRGRRHAAQGGPLPPPGERMRAAFQAVREALARHLEAQQGGRPRRCGRVWPSVWPAAARSPARLCCQWVKRSSPCEQGLARGSRAMQPPGQRVPRRWSQGGRRGSPALSPCSSRTPRCCAVCSRGCGWVARRPRCRKTTGRWRVGANVPKATSAEDMAGAMRAGGSCRTGRRCCGRSVRLDNHDGPFPVDALQPSRHSRVPARQPACWRTRHDHAPSAIPQETPSCARRP